MSQVELSRILKIDPARICEIVKYRIDLFTIDRILVLLEVLKPELKVIVA